MVTTRRRPAAAFSCPWPWLLGVALAGAGCAAERETTLSRSARMREAAELRAERDRLREEMVVLQRTNAEAQAALSAARRDAVAAGAELRATLAALHYDVGRVQTAEQDLAAARQRRAQIEEELLPLRALEATVRDQERLRAEAAGRSAALAAEIEALAKAATAKEAELRPRLAALQQKLAALQQLGVTLAAAEAAIAEALKVVAPPPAPAVAPVPQAPAKK